MHFLSAQPAWRRAAVVGKTEMKELLVSFCFHSMTVTSVYGMRDARTCFEEYYDRPTLQSKSDERNGKDQSDVAESKRRGESLGL